MSCALYKSGLLFSAWDKPADINLKENTAFGGLPAVGDWSSRYILACARFARLAVRHSQDRLSGCLSMFCKMFFGG